MPRCAPETPRGAGSAGARDRGPGGETREGREEGDTLDSSLASALQAYANCPDMSIMTGCLASRARWWEGRPEPRARTPPHPSAWLVVPRAQAAPTDPEAQREPAWKACRGLSSSPQTAPQMTMPPRSTQQVLRPDQPTQGHQLRAGHMHGRLRRAASLRAGALRDRRGSSLWVA